jgi:hypothetical protein
MADRQEMMAKGCPAAHCESVERAIESGISWQQILQALAQFGQTIWSILNVLFPPQPASEPQKEEEAKDNAKAETTKKNGR